jgi:hypothetical protein
LDEGEFAELGSATGTGIVAFGAGYLSPWSSQVERGWFPFCLLLYTGKVLPTAAGQKKMGASTGRDRILL